VTQAVTSRVIVGLLWLTIVIVVAGAWNSGASRALRASAPPGTRTSLMLDDAMYSDASGAGAAAERRVDLYGNEVEEAVSDYGIDIRGGIYERHSPDTEVTQLAAPSM
jgi:hypothetical protein